MLLAVGGAWLLLARFGPAAIDRLLHIGPWLEMRVEGTPYIDWLKGAAVGAIGLGLLLAILGGLFASFTVFTAISIFGVFLGTGAPIIALSVMSGFEADLKSKIRATKADVVIERRRRPRRSPTGKRCRRRSRPSRAWSTRWPTSSPRSS